MVQTISSSTASSGVGPRSLLLHIERTPIIPFAPSKTITVPSRDVTLSSRLFQKNREQQVEAAIEKITHQEERLRAFAKTNLLTLPFRQAGYWMWRGFMGIRRAFTNERFHYLHVKGQNRVWKFDSDPAWALDDGRAVDNLVKIKIA